ncbi:hypothetical protein F5Y15DRAFT_397094 [Xylariaceae sp. FL0016]|nr:hypothetical protein F5Y15DRAFT_397094 [Xylariaceae sp. FL0016]
MTGLFLVPLLKSYSLRVKWNNGSISVGSAYSPQNATDARLRRLGIRTLLGTCCILGITVANLSALLAFDGEAAWLCLLSCKSDVLITACVIHWVTSNDHPGTKPKKQPERRSVSVDGTFVGTPNTGLNLNLVAPLSSRHSAPHPTKVLLDTISGI